MTVYARGDKNISMAYLDWERPTTEMKYNKGTVFFTDEPAPTTYTVVWKNWDGTVLETDTNVEPGTTPSYDWDTPTREGYSFIWWQPSISPVTESIEYTAQFEEEWQEPEIHEWPIDEYYFFGWYQYPGDMLYYWVTVSTSAQRDQYTMRNISYAYKSIDISNIKGQHFFFRADSSWLTSSIAIEFPSPVWGKLYIKSPSNRSVELYHEDSNSNITVIDSFTLDESSSLSFSNGNWAMEIDFSSWDYKVFLNRCYDSETHEAIDWLLIMSWNSQIISNISEQLSSWNVTLRYTCDDPSWYSGISYWGYKVL